MFINLKELYFFILPHKTFLYIYIYIYSKIKNNNKNNKKNKIKGNQI